MLEYQIIDNSTNFWTIFANSSFEFPSASQNSIWASSSSSLNSGIGQVPNILPAITWRLTQCGHLKDLQRVSPFRTRVALVGSTGRVHFWHVAISGSIVGNTGGSDSGSVWNLVWWTGSVRSLAYGSGSGPRASAQILVLCASDSSLT